MTNMFMVGKNCPTAKTLSREKAKIKEENKNAVRLKMR